MFPSYCTRRWLRQRKFMFCCVPVKIIIDALLAEITGKAFSLQLDYSLQVNFFFPFNIHTWDLILKCVHPCLALEFFAWSSCLLAFGFYFPPNHCSCMGPKEKIYICKLPSFPSTAFITVSGITAELILMLFIDIKYEILAFSMHVDCICFCHAVLYCIKAGLDLSSVVLCLAGCERVISGYLHFLLEDFFSSWSLEWFGWERANDYAQHKAMKDRSL